VIAVLLMVGGIALIGMVTAAVATWIIQRVGAQDSALRNATAKQIVELHDEIAKQIDELHDEIAQLTNMIAAQHNDKGLGGGAHN